MAARDREVIQNKNNAIHAAQDLGYGDEVVKKLRQAKTDVEIVRIMRKARLEKFG